MRKIYETSYSDKVAKVYHDREWSEYRVKFYARGVHMDASDYHTDDRQDAIDTANYAIRDERDWCGV